MPRPNPWAVVTSAHLAMIGREVNRALAAGRCGDLRAKAWLRHFNETGKPFAALEAALGGVGHFAFIDGRQRAALNDEWGSMANAYTVDDDFKLGPDAPGLCLVLAFIFLGIAYRAAPSWDVIEDPASGDDAH